MRKNWHFIVLMVLSFAVGCRRGPANTFGIYLTAEPLEAATLVNSKGDWLHVKLQPTPVISETDILAYDFTNHSLFLKPGAVERAVKRFPSMSVWGIPFILVVDGEPIYVGAFMSPASSASMPCPCITLLSPDKWQIDRAYPAPSFGVGPDPRSDERIRQALTALHKLK